MAIIVLIIGESGTGKTASIRNFKKGECGIIGVSKKPLPFKSDLPIFKSDDYHSIINVLKTSKTNSIVIDDAQYLMAFEYMSRAKEKGYEKFTDIGANFYKLIQEAINLPEEKIVYFLSHIEKSSDGSEKCKTIGKLLDEKITIEGLFSIVLKTVVSFENPASPSFLFSTINSGFDTVKSPIGMFESMYIPNDLKIVDETIRDYYNLKKNNHSIQNQKNKGVEYAKKDIMQFAR